MIPLLTELSEFLGDQQDVRDGCDGAQLPNKAMLLKRDVDAALERILVYQHKNPLGGPAKVFEAMAECIRAGDDYYAVLAEYGFQIAAPREITAEASSPVLGEDGKVPQSEGTHTHPVPTREAETARGAATNGQHGPNSEVSKVAYQLQIWADSGERPDEWLLKEWAARLRQSATGGQG